MKYIILSGSGREQKHPQNIRKTNDIVPIILMGYYNVILQYGIKNFSKKCSSIGIDGLIIVDLQPEEDPELFESIKSHNIDLIRLITPTTTKKRLKIIHDPIRRYLFNKSKLFFPFKH